MKYVKTFESFQEQEQEFDFENLILESESEFRKRIRESVERAINNLSKEEFEKLKEEMINLSHRFKLKPNQMTEDNISNAIMSNGINNEVQESYEINEKFFLFKKFNKENVNKFIVSLGAGKTVAGIVLIAIGDAIQHTEYPVWNPLMIIGGIVAILGVITMAIGFKRANSLSNVGKSASDARDITNR